MIRIIVSVIFIIGCGLVPIWYAYTTLAPENFMVERSFDSSVAMTSDYTETIAYSQKESVLNDDLEEERQELQTGLKWFGIINTFLGMLAIGYKSILSIVKTHIDLTALLRRRRR